MNKCEIDVPDDSQIGVTFMYLKRYQMATN